MAYITKNGLRIQSNGLTLIYKPVTITGRVLWDGVDDYIILSSTPDFYGNKKLEFNLNIDTNIPDSSTLFGANAWICMFDVNNSTDQLRVGLYTTSTDVYLRVYVHGLQAPTNNKYIDITSYKGQNILVEIIKSTSSITSIKINGDSKSLNTLNDNVTGNRRWIGPIGFAGTTVPTFLLWDIKLYDDPSGDNTLLNHWKGYPDGNTSTAWVDLVGGNDGTVMGSPIIE